MTGKFIDHGAVQIFMFSVTVYALLGEDIRLAACDIETDYYFMVMNTFSLVMFSIELILSSIGYPDYLFSMFFWLDFFSTASLIADIEPIMNLILGTQPSSNFITDDPQQQ